MTERRVPKPLPENPNRSLLNLGGGDRRGLERAFQTLVGRGQPPRLDPTPILKVLHSLDFVIHPIEGGLLVSHPLAPERQVRCEIEAGRDPQEWVLAWAGRHFPEMEFYLPYISLRASRARKLTGGNRNRPMTPEPEYDEDGFLADYP